MFKYLFVLFLLIPLLEIYILLSVGGWLGLLPTIALVILTAIIGATLVRAQGLITLWRFREKMAHGEIPANEVFTGMALLVAGALLLTPGFFTDTIGFLLLTPAIRDFVFQQIRHNFTPKGTQKPGYRVIEGEIVDKDHS